MPPDGSHRRRAGAGAAGPGETHAPLPDAKPNDAVLDGGDVDVDPLGEERIILDQRPEAFQLDGIRVIDEKEDVRIADIDNRKSGVSEKRVSVRVDLGGPRNIK